MIVAARRHPTRKHPLGFTLLEVMLVLVLMGLAASYVVFNVFGASKSDLLKQEVQRLQVIVDMASDYAVLNQAQLGVRIEESKRQYYFMFLDEEDKWQPVTDEDIYDTYTLPEPFTLTLNLDDLPWDTEDQLFDRDIFDESLSVSDDEVDIGKEEEKKLPPPQILIMSSGEVTPFSLLFSFEPEFGGDEPVYFTLNNEDLPPLVMEGPLEEPPW